MKKILKTKGVILNSKFHKDNVKLLSILCEDGIHSVLIKGVDKMNSGNRKYTIVPVFVEFMMTDSSTLSTFTEGYVLNNYTSIKTDNNKALTAYAMIEKVLTFAEHIDNQKTLFEFVISILNLLEKYDDYTVILNIFEIKLLFLLGIAPNLNRCIKCDSPSDELNLSISLGGCCCKKCSLYNNYELSSEQTKIFKYLYLIKLDKIDQEFLSLIKRTGVNFNNFIDKYYEKHIDFKSKTKKIIEKVS